MQVVPFAVCAYRNGVNSAGSKQMSRDMHVGLVYVFGHWRTQCEMLHLRCGVEPGVRHIRCRAHRLPESGISAAVRCCALAGLCAVGYGALQERKPNVVGSDELPGKAHSRDAPGAVGCGALQAAPGVSGDGWL